MNAAQAIENVGKWLAVLALLFAAGAWVRQQEIRTEAHEKTIQRTQVVHEEDLGVVKQYIEQSELRRAQEQANLRALCSVEKLSRSYCETRGFQYGPQ